MSEFLFVYGTLRRGQPLHPYLAGSRTRFVGEGVIPGRLFDLGDYPAAIADSRRFSTIRGEVHELLVPEEILPVLDEVEGFDPGRRETSLFERVEATVELENRRTLKAWVYFYKRTLLGATEIPNGDYIRYRSE